jgi:hypothetical protein
MGMADYWGGNGRRWDDDAGCLFAYIGPDSTVKDIVDELCDDFIMGGDCDSLPECVDSDDIREAILAMLSDAGRADYESGALFDSGMDWDVDENDADDDDYPFESPVLIVLIEVEDPVKTLCDDCEAYDDV